MKCPRCKATNQEDYRCKNCDKVLKEQCPDCGDWEPIGRPVCFKTVRAINKELINIRREAPHKHSWVVRVLSSTRGEWGLMWLFMAMTWFAILWVGLGDLRYIKHIFQPIFWLMAALFVLHIWCKRRRKTCYQRAEERFAHDHPQKAALIKENERWVSRQR